MPCTRGWVSGVPLFWRKSPLIRRTWPGVEQTKTWKLVVEKLTVHAVWHLLNTSVNELRISHTGLVHKIQYLIHNFGVSINWVCIHRTCLFKSWPALQNNHKQSFQHHIIIRRFQYNEWHRHHRELVHHLLWHKWCYKQLYGLYCHVSFWLVSEYIVHVTICRVHNAITLHMWYMSYIAYNTIVHIHMCLATRL